MEKDAYILERRYIREPMAGLYDFMRCFRDWHKYKSYSTEKARAEAMKALVRKEPAKWEYRIAE